jgi:hypothetical protein
MAEDIKITDSADYERIMRQARTMQSHVVAEMVENAGRKVASVVARAFGLRPAQHNVQDFNAHNLSDIGVGRNWSETVDNRRARINGAVGLTIQ